MSSPHILRNIVLASIFLTLIACIPAATAATIKVPDDYATIQAAVNAASPGDTIQINSGTYNENVNINKAIALIGIAGSEGLPVINSPSGDTTVRITAAGVAVQNVTITGAANFAEAGININGNNNLLRNITSHSNSIGIILYGSNYTIFECNVSDNEEGIDLESVSNSNLSKNTLNNNELQAIFMRSSNNNILTANTANNNSRGIHFIGSSNNIVTANTANNNGYGIYLGITSINNTLTANTANNNDNGIHFDTGSINNTLTANTANNNKNDGIHLDTGSNSNLTSNTANNNINSGIYLSGSNGSLTSNTANNNGYGIYLSGSNNNLKANTTNSNGYGIYLNSGSNNNLTINIANDNNYGIYLDSSQDNRLTMNTATGNYYGIYLDADSSVNYLDANMVTNSAGGTRFGVSLIRGTYPLTVQFSDDINGHDQTWQWNFGDNTPNSTEQSPVHTYTAAGTYTVTLTAGNPVGQRTVQKVGYVVVSAPPAPPGSGGQGNSDMTTGPTPTPTLTPTPTSMPTPTPTAAPTTTPTPTPTAASTMPVSPTPIPGFSLWSGLIALGLIMTVARVRRER